MSFWSADKLRKKLGNGIISDYDPDRVGRANYKLRMGGQAYVSPEKKAVKANDRCLTPLDENSTCTIPPGQFGFLLTEETVTVPYNAIAFISVRATYKFMGLVNVSGFHVDPEWDGPLIFAVFNGGPSPVTVRRFDELFHIWFADLDRSAKKLSPKRPSNGGISSNVINGLGDQLISLVGLSTRFDELEKAHEKLSHATAVKTTLNIAILAALIAIAANLWVGRDNSPAVHLDQRSSLEFPEQIEGATPIQTDSGVGGVTQDLPQSDEE